MNHLTHTLQSLTDRGLLTISEVDTSILDRLVILYEFLCCVNLFVKAIDDCLDNNQFISLHVINNIQYRGNTRLISTGVRAESMLLFALVT